MISTARNSMLVFARVSNSTFAKTRSTVSSCQKKTRTAPVSVSTNFSLPSILHSPNLRPIISRSNSTSNVIPERIQESQMLNLERLSVASRKREDELSDDSDFSYCYDAKNLEL